MKSKDALITVQRSDGSIIARAWPRKRHAFQSLRQMQWGQLFGMLAQWSTQPMPLDQLWALEVSKGTIFLPRDLLLKMATGKMWRVVLKDGTELWNVWDMADQIQVMLDVLSETPGSIVYRAADGWVGLLPGKLNQVLTSDPDTGAVFWGDGSGGENQSVGTSWLGAGSGGASSFMYEGIKFTPIFSQSCVWAAVQLSTTGALDLQAQLWEMEGSTLKTRLGVSQIYSSTFASGDWAPCRFNSPVAMQQGKLYGLLFGCAGASAGTKINGHSQSVTKYTVPWENPSNTIYTDSTPAPDLVVTTSGGGGVCFAYSWRS